MTDKQKAWVDYYKQGYDATEAAKLAGYKGDNEKSYGVIGCENLKKLSQYIKDRDDVLNAERVADMQEINEFWSDAMRNPELDMKDRLKASKYRARSAGAFTEKIRVDGQVDTGVSKLEGILEQLKRR